MYFPYQKGRYEVAPGLLPITKDFGNGSWDHHLIQMGEDFTAYRAQFEENRKLEPVSKYVCIAKDADPAALGATAELIAEQMAKDYSESIQYSNHIFGKFTHQ